MSSSAIGPRGPKDKSKSWTSKLNHYRDPDTRRSVWEIVVTFVPFVLLWVTMAMAAAYGHYWVCALLAVPAGGFLVRLFMIQHDCGHGSFLPSRHANDWTGRIIGVLTLTPYDHWRRSHAIHHASCGNLDRRGIGDVDTLTVREYRALSLWGRLRYRVYRHPAVLFGFGPLYLFLLQNRLPIGFMRKGWMPWLSTMTTNLGIVALVVAGMWIVGPLPFVLTHVPIFLVGATIGVWLFYVQHQFQGTLWDKGEDWTLQEAALHGSSYYVLPGILRWFSANIGIHHVHHLASRIPYYRLSEVLRDHPELRDVGRVTLWQSLGCVRLALWDEATRRLVTFAEAAKLPFDGARTREAALA